MTVIASCHCGGTRIELPETPADLTQCTCSYCTKSGGLWGYYAPEQPKILSDTYGAVYSASGGMNQHHFCANCGCQTFGISPDWSLEDTTVPDKKKFAINARLFDDFALFKSIPVGEIDGRNLW